MSAFLPAISWTGIPDCFSPKQGQGDRHVRQPDVAAYIVQQCVERKISYTNTKIQKLLYCLYGVMLAWKGSRVCDEHPHALPYGPVFPRVFKLIHNGCDVTEYSTLVRDRGSEEIKAAVQSVLDVFGPLRASNLSAWSHCIGSPWWKVRGQVDTLNRIVPDETIREYFGEKVLVAGTVGQ